MIDKDVIESRKKELIVDLDKIKSRYEELEKTKIENIALQNALSGAIQQCDDFLKKIDDDASDEG